jgi:hypothetical protein
LIIESKAFSDYSGIGSGFDIFSSIEHAINAASKETKMNIIKNWNEYKSVRIKTAAINVIR